VTHGRLLTHVMCGMLTYQSIVVDSVLDYYEGVLMTVCADDDARSKTLVFWSLVFGFVARSAVT